MVGATFDFTSLNTFSPTQLATAWGVSGIRDAKKDLKKTQAVQRIWGWTGGTGTAAMGGGTSASPSVSTSSGSAGGGTFKKKYLSNMSQTHMVIHSLRNIYCLFFFYELTHIAMVKHITQDAMRINDPSPALVCPGSDSAGSEWLLVPGGLEAEPELFVWMGTSPRCDCIEE